MRQLLPSLVVAFIVVAAHPGAASAQVSATGWVGAGMFGDDPAMTIDVGLDYSGRSLSFGLGGRVRFLAADGFRERDWDEPSELVSLLRYVRYERYGDSSELIVVAGKLGDVDLGHGTIFDGYESTLNLDHLHIGMQVRSDGERVRFDAVIDDIIAPRLIGARTVLLSGRHVSFGATAAADISSPSLDGPTFVPFAVLDAAVEFTSKNDGETIRGYVDFVSMPRIGSGAHIGVSGRARFGQDGNLFHVGARGELRLSSDGYIPGWIGPLYEVTRSRVGDTMSSQLDLARTRGEVRLTALGGLSLQSEKLGTVQVTYASRPGLPKLLYGRIVAPSFTGIQAAFWAAVELEKTGAGAAALELRARLNRHAFLVIEAARLYRDGVMGIEPVWLATVAIGASIGQ